MKLAAIAPRTISFHHDRPERTSPATRPSLVTPITLHDKRRQPGQVHLTLREREVLSLLCEGLPNKTIGRELGIAAGTVKIHIGKILGELGVSSRLQAVVAAQRLGLLRDAGSRDRPAYDGEDRVEYAGVLASAYAARSAA